VPKLRKPMLIPATPPPNPKPPGGAPRLKRRGGILAREFRVIRGATVLGEVRYVADGKWAANVHDDVLGIEPLPGVFASKEEARDAVVDAYDP